MKKLVLALATIAVALTSCNNGTPTASLNDGIDSLSYQIGLANTKGLKEYLVNQMGVDTAYIDDFIKGLKEGATAASDDDKKQAAYFAGIQIGQQISTQMFKGAEYQIFGNDSTQHLSLNNYLAGFIGGVKNNVSVTDTTGQALTPETAEILANDGMTALREKAMLKQYESNKAEGEAYIAKVAKEADIKQIGQTGVYYRVIKTGNGPIPADTSNVKINYEGRLIDGTVFDSSYQRGQATDLNVSQVIKGWTIALTNMPVGSTWEVFIPQDLAYGVRETPQFKPFSAMIFKIELIGINK